MDTIYSKFIKADNILTQFAENNEKFENRFEALLTEMYQYIEVSEFQDKVMVNELLLGYTLLDYFEDIRRLKEFHGLKHINSVKIVAYTSYWLLKRKPLQVLSQDKDALYVNERFVIAYIMGFISSDKGNLLTKDDKIINSFLESLLYHFKYRAISANNIELLLLSFFAGEKYQNENLEITFTEYDKQ